MIRQRLIFILFILFFCLAGSRAQERPTYYEASPAYPLSLALPEFDSPQPFLTGEKSWDFLLTIDKKGKVEKISGLPTADSLITKYLFSSLKTLKFAPAMIDRKETASELPVIAVINPRFRTTSVTFPVDSALNIVDKKLFVEAVKKLGVEPPQVKIFPSYFCESSSRDSLQLLQYLLLKLKLDSSGKAAEINEISSTIGGFSSQLISAVLWAKFLPLTVKNKPRSCECYLLVSFFPQLEYPTKRTEFGNDSAYAWYDNWRVRILTDTLGVMLPPIPRVKALEQGGLINQERYIDAEVMATVMVDKTGKFQVRQTDSRDAKIHRTIQRVCNEYKFFPAMDFSGQAIDYYGQAKFIFHSSKSVRLELNWLE